jgi:hypothetical protein
MEAVHDFESVHRRRATNVRLAQHLDRARQGSGSAIVTFLIYFMLAPLNWALIRVISLETQRVIMESASIGCNPPSIDCS